MNYEKLTKDELLSEHNLEEIFNEPDDILLQHSLLALEERARELKCLSAFKRLEKAYYADRKSFMKTQAAKAQVMPEKTELLNYTNFPEGSPIDRLCCGDWIANEQGVRKIFPNGEVVASYFPVMPIMYLRNVHTHAEKVILAYYSENAWHTVTANRSDISSNTAIVKLSDLGLKVTSNTAKPLIDYLSFIEAKNSEIIPHKKSTTKMGWHGTEFMPYSEQLVFDGGTDYNSLYASLSSHGDYYTWLNAVKKVRATRRLEPLFFLAASFGSPLLELLGVQSFAVSLWGDSEGGKTICTRLAASVWADSREGRFWGSFLSTEAALEIKQGFLNNLPCLIDDSSNVKDKEHFNFSTFVYNRCNEKGKTRSNIKLGINAENTWRQIICMTGEQPVVTEQMQGGAINRLLELTCGYESIFKEPEKFCEMLDNNYGHAGKLFIERLQSVGKDYIRQVFNKEFEEVNKLDKMKKQSKSLALILAADKLIEQLIFKDGITIDLNNAATVLAEKSFVSENERCYEYILQQAAIQADKFKPTMQDKEGNDYYKGDIWGKFNKDETVLYIAKSIFDKLCAQGGFSSKKFLDWAKKKNKILSGQAGEKTMPVRLPNSTVQIRCVSLLLPDNKTATSNKNNNAYGDVPF